MRYNQETKEIIYKWRQGNQEVYRKVVREGVRRYADKNKEKIADYKRKFYRHKLEWDRLRNINIFE